MKTRVPVTPQKQSFDRGWGYALRTYCKQWVDRCRPALRPMDFGELPILPGLAHVAALQAQQTYSAQLAELLQWAATHPPRHRHGWNNGRAVALRVIKLICLTTLCAPQNDEARHIALWTALREHGIWLERYPAMDHYAHHGMIAEALALFLLGALCPELPEAEHWKTEGWLNLQANARLLILEDGTGGERSLHSHAFVLEALLVALQVAKTCALDIPESLSKQALQAAEFLRWCVDAKGNVPFMGSVEELSIIGTMESYIPSVLACAASYYQRSDLSPPPFPLQLRNYWMEGGTATTTPEEGLRSFERGGYSIGRHMVNNQELWLAVSHGVHAPTAHADALSLWLHLDGQPILVDSGSFNPDIREWKEYFHATAAHNSLVMEDSVYNISHAQRTALETGSEHWQIDTIHDGYNKRFGALHRRRVSVTPRRGFTVEDSISGNQPRNVAIYFHLHPSLTATQKGNLLMVARDDKPILRIMHLSSLAVRIAPANAADCGWYCERPGQKTTACRIIFSGILAPGAKAVTDFSFVWI